MELESWEKIYADLLCFGCRLHKSKDHVERLLQEEILQTRLLYFQQIGESPQFSGETSAGGSLPLPDRSLQQQVRYF